MAERGGKREGSGRKKMEGVVFTKHPHDAESWAKIPKPKAEYVRQAVKENLSATKWRRDDEDGDNRDM